MPKIKRTRVTQPIGSDNQRPLRRALIRESARWIAQRRWHTFATLTFETEVDEPAAAKEFERYVRRLEQRSLGRVSYFAVAAKSPVFGRVHLHAVLGFTRQPPAIAYRKAWLAGLAKINCYEEERGGYQYIATHVTIPGAEILLCP
ncbi:hypothetical protein [Gemmatimonas sp.]|uniref:rolling circle replication-associated protein n=1 Tax=Gemmatimonas sp. TaxID=1962908 RepID=UPI00286DC32C|nr:hypothetical protein [Gemmatimonas sp.]